MTKLQLVHLTSKPATLIARLWFALTVIHGSKRLHHSSTPMYYCQHKLKSKQWGRPGNEAKTCCVLGRICVYCTCCVTHEIRAHIHSFRSSQTMKQRQNLGRWNTEEENKLLILLLLVLSSPSTLQYVQHTMQPLLCTSSGFLYHYFPGRSYPTQIAFHILTIAKESLNGWCDWFSPA